KRAKRRVTVSRVSSGSVCHWGSICSALSLAPGTKRSNCLAVLRTSVALYGSCCSGQRRKADMGGGHRAQCRAGRLRLHRASIFRVAECNRFSLTDVFDPRLTPLKPEFGRPDKAEPSDIFVLMPFSEEMAEVYRVIKICGTALNLTVAR